MFDQLCNVQNFLLIVAFFISLFSTIVITARLSDVRYLSGHFVNAFLNKSKRSGKLSLLSIFDKELDLIDHLVDEGYLIGLVCDLKSFLEQKKRSFFE